MEPLDRATIWPYREGKPGELYYQRYAHPNALAAEARARGAGRRGDAALPLRRGRDDGARTRAAGARPDDRAGRGRLLRHRRALRDARALGRPPRRVRPDRPAARRRRPRLARGALEPVPDHARPRGGSGLAGAGGGRLDRRDARLPTTARRRRGFRAPQRDEVPRRPRRRAARRGRLPFRRGRRAPARVPRSHRDRGRTGPLLAALALAADAARADGAPHRERDHDRRRGCATIRRSRSSATRASAACSRSTSPAPRPRTRSRPRCGRSRTPPASAAPNRCWSRARAGKATACRQACCA